MDSRTLPTASLIGAEHVIQQVISTWVFRNSAVTAAFGQYEDVVYEQEVAPGRNRAVYLLGHLTVANDGMLPLLGLGERLFPELVAQFLTAPDRTLTDRPSLPVLREQWQVVNAALAAHFDTMLPSQWLEKNTSVSREAFAQDPLRNKLSILLGRISHQSWHLGQLAFLTPRPELNQESWVGKTWGHLRNEQ